MLHRSAKVRPGQRALIHGAAGGVGSALLQLGGLAALEMCGTCSSRGASAVCDLGAIPIDYQHLDFVKEIRRLTSNGVDVVFDGIGGTHMWRSRKALRPGGRVVGLWPYFLGSTDCTDLPVNRSITARPFNALIFSSIPHRCE